ncbi:uncharacterized protein L969DRAFT_86335 [Mixia osmundae IAM 14324]|nr:uncharacterized protein L969DRAFT_86335 [Mixia osmundae IAM 14324]KEI41087.1 hypothetical protein L969DRAFT_86335 [Mixia osmundae IAM 14324]
MVTGSYLPVPNGKASHDRLTRSRGLLLEFRRRHYILALFALLTLFVLVRQPHVTQAEPNHTRYEVPHPIADSLLDAGDGKAASAELLAAAQDDDAPDDSDGVSGELGFDADQLLPSWGSPVPLALEAIKELVGIRPQFIVLDYPSPSSWPQQRRLIESCLEFGRLFERIPIIPDSIWTHRCVEGNDCSRHAIKTQVIDGQQYFQLDIAHFVDMSHLRSTYGPVITLYEYCLHFGLSPKRIRIDGLWDHKLYHLAPGAEPVESILTESNGASLFTLPEGQYEHTDTLRVDTRAGQDDAPWDNKTTTLGLTHEAVLERMSNSRVLSIDALREALQRDGEFDLPDEDSLLIEDLKRVGFVALYTYSSVWQASGALVAPDTQIAPAAMVHGLAQNFVVPDDVFLLQGSLPVCLGGMRYSTSDARDRHTAMMLESLVPPQHIQSVAASMALAFSTAADGRAWTGIDLSPSEGSRQDSLAAQTLDKLHAARIALRSHIGPNRAPEEDDAFYFYTNQPESSAEVVQLRENRGIVLQNMLAPADRRELGYAADFPDLLDILYEQLLARSDYFIGSLNSTLSGGVLNSRQARGGESWSYTTM